MPTPAKQLSVSPEVERAAGRTEALARSLSDARRDALLKAWAMRLTTSTALPLPARSRGCWRNTGKASRPNFLLRSPTYPLTGRLDDARVCPKFHFSLRQWGGRRVAWAGPKGVDTRASPRCGRRRLLAASAATHRHLPNKHLVSY